MTEAFTPAEIALIQEKLGRDVPAGEFKAFLYQCERCRLNPLLNQIHAVKRYDNDSGSWKVTTQASIDGFRLCAERTGKYVGQLGPWWCGDDGKWLDCWVSKAPPAAAKVAVLRSDFQEPLFAVARFESYAQRKKDGKLNRFWSVMGDVMIAKVAEALALRRAFPQELSGIYSHEEMSQAESEPQQPAKAALPTGQAGPPMSPPKKQAAQVNMGKDLDQALSAIEQETSLGALCVNRRTGQDGITLAEIKALQLSGPEFEVVRRALAHRKYELIPGVVQKQHDSQQRQNWMELVAEPDFTEEQRRDLIAGINHHFDALNAGIQEDKGETQEVRSET